MTSDIPLASRCVKTGATVLAPNGRPFTEAAIGMAVATRNLMEELRAIYYLQFIPRLLQDALIGLKSFVNANLSIDFSKITEPKTNPLKTGLTVPQIAFLFKILSEHNDIGIETKTKTELYNFISQNFATKKSTENGISIKKLAEYFNEPDTDAQVFWYGNC